MKSYVLPHVMTQHKPFNLALTLLLLAGAVQAATPEAPVDALDAYDPDNIFAHILLGGEYVGSPREAAPGQEGAAIEALYADYARAWLTNDESTADAVLSLFSKQAVIVPSGGTAVYTGHEEMQEFWFPADAPPSTVDEFDHETIKVTMAGRQGTLLSRFTLQFSMDGRSYRTEGYNQMSAIFDQGKWRILAMMWSHPPWQELESPDGPD